MTAVKDVILNVRNLSLGFGNKKTYGDVLDRISFELKQGEILGIVGESGSGKTMTALAVMDLLPQNAKITGGSIRLMGHELLTMTETERRMLKGTSTAMIFQEPMSSLNPVLTIGEQVEEMLVLHSSESKTVIRKKTLAMMEQAGLKDLDQLFGKFPHQLSGGMRQRVMIAMAMLLKPALLIADEPTTALDVTIQAQILELIKKLNRDYNTAVLFISHDLGVIKSICGRALVLKNGRIEEQGNIHNLFYHPQNEYTIKLLSAVKGREKTDEMSVSHENRLLELEHRETILTVDHLNSYYTEKRQGTLAGKYRKQILNQITFSVRKGEILGIVGESGSGKSTLAKSVTGLVKDIEGTIQTSGQRPQMVFQDPASSLNRVKTVEWILEEPMRIQGKIPKEQRRQRVHEMIAEVGLKEKYLKRYASQLSGGQRQRVSIACALMLRPRLIILDEPVSALDVTIQAQILDVLLSLRERYHLSYVLISHDLNVIYQMCDRVGVMYQGEIIEMAGCRRLYDNPQHWYTKQLLSATLGQEI